MKHFGLTFLLLGLSCLVQATPADDYLKRFNAYYEWHQNLPESPDDQFLTFIQEKTPLATKLREQWLYRVAQQKDWTTYKRYYQPSLDANLQCFDLLADYHLGDTNTAFANAEKLWLTSHSQPPVCNQLFSLMLQQEGFNEDLITQRIRLSLEKRNIALTRYLFKQYKSPQLKEEQLLIKIYQNPRRIIEIQPGKLHSDIYLYGLKRLVAIDMQAAIREASSGRARKLLSQAEHQAFIGHVALYKAMRNQKDTFIWFAMLKPNFYNDTLLEWEIRAALKDNNWKLVEQLIQKINDKDNPCWQYWLARAKQKLGQVDAAKPLYTALGASRSYYGFLASQHLHQPFAFKNEQPVNDLARLKPYKPILDSIQSLYQSKEIASASRLVNDFISELPKEDKSALIYWLDQELQWYAKSVYLSGDKKLINQLPLRFPLANHAIVKKHALQFQLPKALVYAIIRQESAFQADVVSQAGALGLMQLLPETAHMMSKSKKIAYTNKVQLFSSQKNINLGTAYLNYLAHRFNNHFLLMVAAYNAGPRRVDYWLKNHPPKSIDIWIETLPWHETRNYIKNVIAFYAVYQYRLNLKPNLSNFLKPFNR